jgi:hypothetical protein
VIVRISTDGQYELLETDVETLDELDNQAVAACRVGNDEQFSEVFREMLTFVRTNGQRVPDDELKGSDLILPPPDSSMEEAMAEFTGEGLIPE